MTPVEAAYRRTLTQVRAVYNNVLEDVQDNACDSAVQGAVRMHALLTDLSLLLARTGRSQLTIMTWDHRLAVALRGCGGTELAPPTDSGLMPPSFSGADEPRLPAAIGLGIAALALGIGLHCAWKGA